VVLLVCVLLSLQAQRASIDPYTLLRLVVLYHAVCQPALFPKCLFAVNSSIEKAHHFSKLNIYST
jgi:hypothetical protein